MAASGALANIDDDAILDRIKAGEYATVIAEELGVDPSALYHRYAHLQEYRQARELGAEVRLETAEREIEGAPDPFRLARAEKKHKAIAWRIEREFPARWGQTKHLIVENVGDLGDRLMRARDRKERRTIDVTPDSVSLDAQATDSKGM
jgi:hypothetical protein